MKKAGNDADSARRLQVQDDVDRLRKAGASDLAARPERYGFLASLADPKRTWKQMQYLDRLPRATGYLESAISAIPDRAIGEAVRELFAVGAVGVLRPLAERRRLADRIATGRGRRPDTVRRFLEHPILDPAFVEALLVAKPVEAVGHRTLQYGVDPLAWEDDLDGALVAFSRQSFVEAEVILRPHLLRIRPGGFDGQEHLAAKTFRLYGDILRDRGITTGAKSAERQYSRARELHDYLGQQRRVAQDDLLIAVVREMNDDLNTAIAAYSDLASDERLTALDRGRAALWVGTAMTKARVGKDAVDAVQRGIHAMEDSSASDAEIATGFQKLAFAELFAGRIGRAHDALDVSEQTHQGDSQLREVRRLTARGHVLIVDSQTRDAGLATLLEARQLAVKIGLDHQVRAIDSLLGDYQIK